MGSYFQLIYDQLATVEKDVRRAQEVLGQLQLFKMDVSFLKTFCCVCLETWDYTTDEKSMHILSFIITNLQLIWERKQEKEVLDHIITTKDIIYWDQLSYLLEEKIQLSKQEIQARWVDFFHWSFRCKPLTSYKIVKFLDFILDNLNDLVCYKADKIVPFKKQIKTLEEKLVFFKNFLKLTANCMDNKQEFNMFVQVFANDAAYLAFLYWVNDANDKIASETNSLLYHMLQKIKPVTPKIAGLYYRTLKAIYARRYEPLRFGQTDPNMFGKTVYCFVELCLEDPVTPLKDDFQFLQEDIVFLLTFLNDPPNEKVDESILKSIDVYFWEGVYGLFPFDDMDGDFSEKKALLRDFMINIEALNDNVRQIYSKFPDSSYLCNFPKVVSPRLLDCLIQNLRNLKERMIGDRNYVPYARHKIIKIEEELVSLCPLFNHFFDLKSELSETWLEVVNLVYLTEHVINSCISSCFAFDHPIWYYMAYLSDVFDKIKVVKTKLKRIKDNTMYNARSLPCSTSFISTPTVQAGPSGFNEIVVGLEDEVEKITGKLISGNMPLDIVSIVGMSGLGKTTVAKKVYGSSLVKQHFDVFAFCSVSQDCNIRRLLLDILSDIEGNTYKMDDKKGNTHKMDDKTKDDLAQKLWQRLTRRKYLIVLDDIWSASVWDEVRCSFPDDRNGSKVMFTSQSHAVAEDCKLYSNPHVLRFLSEFESWELLRKKVFDNGNLPLYFEEIGKLIAGCCKGLPLAVSLIAGLLARTQKDPTWWIEVAQKVISYLSDEGCMRILELSYTQLPENLKPCLLYLGAFPKDWLIRGKNVILLWIAEGFIQESKTKSKEDVAKDYLRDLVDRSLIIVYARSCDGEIKYFIVHDVIHAFCRTKCQDMNFFHLNHGIASFCSSDPWINNHYRFSTMKLGDVTGSSLLNTCSVIYFSVDWESKIRLSTLKKFRHAQVLDFNMSSMDLDIEHINSMANLRHIHALLNIENPKPSLLSISNLWNIGSLTLISPNENIHLPRSFWRMTSLTHVNVDQCILEISHGHELLKLDKVVSFSRPVLSTGKDVQWLLQRLPAVCKLKCFLEHKEESTETLDFDKELESLKLTQSKWMVNTYWNKFHSTPRLSLEWFHIKFPWTLKKLTLEWFNLPWTAISAMADLQCLEVLKLTGISFPEPRLEMEDVTFRNLKYFKLHDLDLVEWNATTESLPCLEQLVIECPKLEDLPTCFEEILTMKKMVVTGTLQVTSSALCIRDELMELGTIVEVSIFNASDIQTSDDLKAEEELEMLIKEKQRLETAIGIGRINNSKRKKV